MKTSGITAALPVQDLGRAKAFYVEKVGLQALESGFLKARDGQVGLTVGDGVSQLFVYPAQARSSGEFTQAVIHVTDVRAAVEEMRRRGVEFEEYDTPETRTENGIARMPGGRWDAGREHRRSGDGRLVLVAADEPGHVVAFIDMEPDGHIDRLFCAPEVAGRGVASRLHDAIETAARAQGIQRLFTEASELARRFFERKGFTVLERQEMILRGVPIHNCRMAKTLG